MAYNQHSDPFEDQVHVPTLPYTSSSPRPSSPRHGAQQTLYPAGEGAAESQLSLAETKYDALGEDDEEVAPLRQAYPPSHGVPLPPGLPEEYGFPSAGYTPSFSDAGRPYSSVSSGLYRSQTTTEAWHRRQRIDRNRAKTVKVKLERGHFIADYAVPTPVRNANLTAGYAGEPQEFSHMRYSAVTCDPDDFTREDGWTLRAENYGRSTDLLVAITYYNEDKILVARTLHGVMLNLRDMAKSRWSEFSRMGEGSGGEAGTGDAWKRIVVTLVFDGIEPADKATLDVLATLGLYQDAVMKKMVDEKETQAHLFEYTTALSMSPKPELVQPSPGDPANLVPVQMILCLKQKNAKKINSHRWLFNAIAKHLEPEVCILIDAGTRPGPRSLYYLWEAFHHNKHLGGACGEIHADLGKGWRKLLNPLVCAQNFEYKMSNILDKPLESSFGYVSVLPGAFSAYRYSAIQGRPLQQYFHGDHSLAARLGKKGIQGMGIFKKNMFLAEDRILCFELVAKANSKWVLGYVKPAKGETDVPENAAELIGQRRRWLNGSFAAGVYSLAHFTRMYRSNHSAIRMLFFHIQALYTSVGLFLSWFAPAAYFITFAAIIDIVHDDWRDPWLAAGLQPGATKNSTSDAKFNAQQDIAFKIKDCWAGTVLDDSAHLEDPTKVPSKLDWLGAINWAAQVIYLALVALQVILALGNRPKGERVMYTISIAIFALFAAYLIVVTLILTTKAFCPIGVQISDAEASGTSTVGIFFGSTYGVVMAGLAGTFGIYIVSSILYLDPWHILTSMPAYLLVAPSFTNILNVYAFCNLHDVSWGTKGSDKADELPKVSSKPAGKEGEAKVVEDITRNQEDLDANFQETVQRAVAPFKEHTEIEQPSIDDQQKTFRTRFVSCWLFTNAALAIGISRLDAAKRTYFFSGLLWATFFLAMVRFIGFLYYLTGESIFRAARLCARARK